MDKITGTISGVSSVVGTINKVAAEVLYDGPYEFEPSAEEQTIQISGKKARQDIVIAPIPNNYGLITWNGATLTVS